MVCVEQFASAEEGAIKVIEKIVEATNCSARIKTEVSSRVTQKRDLHFTQDGRRAVLVEIKGRTADCLAAVGQVSHILTQLRENSSNTK